MPSFTQSLVAWVVFSHMSSLYASELSPTYNVPPVIDCSALEPVTVFVTMTAATTDYSEQSYDAPQKYSRSTSVSHEPSPTGLETTSCFDRKNPPLTYSYSHDGYHLGPKASSPSSASYHQTTKVSYPVPYNNVSASHHYGSISNVSCSHPTSTPLPPTNSTGLDCQPEFQLNGAFENVFNKKGVPFTVEIRNCSKLDVAKTTAFANFVPVRSLIP